MTPREAPDAIDTRIVLRAYAGLVGAAGFLMFGWGGLIFRTPPIHDPWGQWVIVRLIGGVMLAAALSARGLSQVDDPITRHRALFWFLLAHLALFFVLLTQIVGAGIPGPGDFGFYGLSAAIVLLSYFWLTGDGYSASALFAQAPPVTDRVRAEYEERIREAASQEERNRLARDLHDSIKQQIFVMQTAAATAQARFDGDPAGAKTALEQLRDAARDAMTEMEAMLDNLRATPLENLGLVEALKKQCEALALRTGADVRFEHGALPPSETLAPGAQQAIFRVAQESLANIGRHARARAVRVTLGVDNRRVELEIEDDGVGFERGTTPEGMGLRNMQARADALNGTLAVTSRPGSGTRVQLSVPYALPALVTYRRRAGITTAVVSGLLGARIAIEIALYDRVMITLADLLFAFVALVILWRERASYRRAIERSKAAWLESPSRS